VCVQRAQALTVELQKADEELRKERVFNLDGVRRETALKRHFENVHLRASFEAEPRTAGRCVEVYRGCRVRERV
jgi:hypothetical protein